MIKEIKYKGYSATPSDYACQDGELSMSLNMVNEDGELHSVTEPEKGDFLGSSDLIEGAPSYFTGKVMLIHYPSGGFKNYILQEGNHISIWQTDSLNFEERYYLYTAEEGEKIINCEPIGNTLVITTSNGIFYALWQTTDADLGRGNYKYLGKLPETPEFLFYLKEERNPWFDEHDTRAYKKFRTCYSKPEGSKFDVETEMRTYQDSLMGDINKCLAESEKKAKKFVYPFYIRYAYRLYDNTLSKHSFPILIVPSVINPIIDVMWEGEGSIPPETSSGEGGPHRYRECSYKVGFIESSLRVYAGIKKDLSKWGDVIKGIEFYISAPIYSYDASPDPEEYNRSEHKFRRYDSLTGPLVEDTDGDRWTGTNQRLEGSIYDSIFTYGVNETGKRTIVDRLGKRYATKTCLIPPVKESFFEDLEENSVFYFFSEIDIEQYDRLKNAHITEDALPVDMKSRMESLREITSQRRMSDDFISHQDLVAKDTFVYNNRLHIANIRRPIFDGLGSSNYYSQATKGKQETGFVRFHVKKNGQTFIVGSNTFKYVKGFESIAQFIYYPDDSATQMDVFDSAGNIMVSVPLKSHDFLNGSYFFGRLKELPNNPAQTLMGFSTHAYVEEISAVYVSLVNNPFVFTPVDACFAGVGEIIALCANTQAISQGQFGEHPLYVFTDMGVWALPVAKDGSYLPAKPVTRDVCLSRESITQIDDGVLFATERGVMMISGGKSVCISDFINGKPFELEKLPCADKLKELLGDSYQEITSVDWLEYVKNCRIVYDYVHQHIIVFNPAYKYAYFYSLKDKTWGLIHNNYKYPINDYPSALVVDNENYVQDFSKGTLRKKGLIVTRPIKLDMPNDLKTIDRMFQRGVFRPGHVKTVLYGSRDIINWVPVASSEDHSLHTVHGTPYKYFRIVLICDLLEDESVYGASIEMRPRMLNKLR